MSRAGLVWVAVAAVLSGACSQSEVSKPEPATVGTGGAGADVRSDEDFVRDLAAKNLAGAELSRLALSKATNANVKVFAQQLIADHTAAADRLKNVVAGQVMGWPDQLDEEHRKTATELDKTHGANFERAYLEAIVEGHQDLAAKLESRLDVESLAAWKTAAAGRTRSQALPEPGADMRDVAVRPNQGGSEMTMKINRWAAETYPVAQKHLDTARALANEAKKRSTE
jgi:putative membrane protein